VRAVLIEVGVADVDRDAGLVALRDQLVPMIRQLPGFRGGTWLTGNGDGLGLSLTLWDSDDQAAAFAARFGLGTSPTVNAAVTRCELREVASTAEATATA
jgi:hypothetical protein